MSTQSEGHSWTLKLSSMSSTLSALMTCNITYFLFNLCDPL